MARSRNIKPGFFTNDDLVELDFATRLLFAGLWTVADKAGRLEDRPKKIKIAVFPADDVDVEAMLAALAGRNFITRYSVNGVGYIQIVSWAKHQNPHHTEKASVIPPPVNGELTVKAPLEPVEDQEQDGGNPADSLIPDSLIPSKATPARKRAPAFDPRETELPDWLPRELWVTWCDDRQERKKPITREGAKQQLAKLDGYRAAGHSPRSVIEHSIAGGYQGLFAPAVQKGQQAPEPREWHESRSGVERKARELGLDPHRIDEQWPTFRQRVMQAVKDLAAPALTLDQLSAMAERRAA
jgi:hypothetical protein